MSNVEGGGGRPWGRAGGPDPYRKIAPPLCGCMGRPITCPLCADPVGTVVFDANNHVVK